MSERDDIKKIIAGCLSKEAKSQRLLLEHYADQLYAVCVRYLPLQDEAKDALQESWIKIFKYLETYDPTKGLFYPWIKTIAIRECLKKIKKKKVNTVCVDEKVNELKDQIEPDIHSKLNEAELIKLIHQLPESLREVFNLYVIDGYKHKEISEMLCISVDASKSKLKRAKSLLREKLNQLNIYKSWAKTA